MVEKLKFFGLGALFVCLVVVAYKMGELQRPEISYEMAYDIVQKQVNKPKKIGVRGNQVDRFIYVPVYSHVYGSGGQPVEMAVTLSLRNVSQDSEVQIKEVFYYNTQGKLIRQYLKNGYTLKALETMEIFIKDTDIEGGSGANFIVGYTVNEFASKLLVEAVMTAVGKDSSLIFSSRGRAL